VVLTVVFQAFWRYIAAHPNLLDEHVNPAAVRKITSEYRFGPLFYVAALVLAYFSAVAGLALTLLLAIYFGLTARTDPVHST